MTKQRKMLIGVLCLGLGGLAVDRFVLGSPETASADEDVITLQLPEDPQPLVEPGPEPAADATDEELKALPSYSSLTERLILAQEQAGADPQIGEQQTDPFTLPEQWRGDQSKPLAQTADTGPVTREHRITNLVKLDGTVRSLVDANEMMAVISGGGMDGKAIRVGQIVRVPNEDGTYSKYRLIEVGTRYVIWQWNDENGKGGDKITMEVEDVL